MKCQICGGDYIALGVHIRRKHGISLDDYREEFGILKVTPLVERDLSEHISLKAKQRIEADAQYRAELIERCARNSMAAKGGCGPVMSQPGRDALAKRNAERGEAYLQAKAAPVLAILASKKTVSDVCEATGVSPATARKIAARAGVSHQEAAQQERKRRLAKTLRDRALTQVQQLMPYHNTTRSIVEMCRLSGVSIKKYKKLVAAGLVPMHPNSPLARAATKGVA